MTVQTCSRDELEYAINQLITDGLTNSVQGINTSEIRVLSSFAKEDFITYIKVLHGGKSLNYLCKLYRNGKLNEFINEWVGFWIIKWRQRVKLMFREDQEQQDIEESEDLKLIGKRDINKVSKLVKRALIENNEICGVNVVSSYLTMQFLRELTDMYGVTRVHRMIKLNDPAILSYVVSRVNEIAKTQQPLVILFLKINERRQLFIY